VSGRNCAECGAAIEREPIAEASRPWRHRDLEGEDRRPRTCPGASLLALGALVRVDNDPASDAPWSVFVDVNRDAGLSLEEIADIEETLVACGEHVGHHDADVGLVSHLDEKAIEASVFGAPIEGVRDFVADFWHDGEEALDGARDVDVRRFAVAVIRDGLADGNVTRGMIPHLFDAPRTLGAPTIEELLDQSNKMRHAGEHGIANALIEQIKRAAGMS